MIPYFSIIDSPGDLIFLYLILMLCIVLYIVTHMFCMDRTMTKLEYIISAIVVPLVFMFLLWTLIGDSTKWSEPIGLWLRGK